jgi:5-formyltetrahydrofolate cyclo-ligase
MDTKKDFRKKFIERRNKLTSCEVVRKSEEIFGRIYALKEYERASVVMAYMSFGNEVMTKPFVERCLRDGKRTVLPRVMISPDGYRYLAIYEIKDIDKDLIPGFKGILEPDPSVLEPMEPETVDFAVIPGVAFDRHCNRMGFGAGYYDRFLPQLKAGCLRAGVAFDIQLAERVPTDEHDFRLDIVVTESEVIGCTQSNYRKDLTDEQ